MTEPDHVATARAAYDRTADIYAASIGTAISSAVEGPLDRAMLHAFAELVVGQPGALVADIGCGPGRVAAFLAARGTTVIGIDPSTAMLDLARRAHPALRFEIGLLTDLPLPDASLAGAACWYSIIHTPPGHLGEVAEEIARVLAPGAHLLVAFQAGEGQAVHRQEVRGRAVSLTSFRHDPDHVGSVLARADLHVRMRALREPMAAHEDSPQAFLVAQRVVAAAPTSE